MTADEESSRMAARRGAHDVALGPADIGDDRAIGEARITCGSSSTF
jgi:hypothetical protein